MYNFYQSALRRQINELVYQKETFEEELFGTTYFGIIKRKKFWPISLQRYQILGVQVPDDVTLIQQEVKRIQNKYGKKFWNILFQRWITNQMVSFENISHRSSQFREDVREMRLWIRDWLTSQTDLKIWLRENMPEANIVYEITKTDEQLLSEMNSGCKERVKSSLKKWAIFRVAEPREYEQFYKDWLRLAGAKWFNIIDYTTYRKLVDYITDNKCGNVFVAKTDGELLAWSICIYDKHRIIYLYGFASREEKFRNFGAHHFLKFKIFGRAREKGLSYCDMLGWAPTGFDEHPLAGVSKFKESLGWSKIEYYGNFDIVLNPILYRIFAWRQKEKK